MTRQTYQTNGSETESPNIDWEKAQRGTRLLLEAIGEDLDKETLTETWQRRVPAALKTLTEASVTPKNQRCGPSMLKPVTSSSRPEYRSTASVNIIYSPTTARSTSRTDRPAESLGSQSSARYVRWQSRRLTIQEDLTRDIAAGLAEEIGAEAVRVEMTATNLCEAVRGVEAATETTTQATIGELTENEQRRFRSTVDSNE